MHGAISDCMDRACIGIEHIGEVTTYTYTIPHSQKNYPSETLIKEFLMQQQPHNDRPANNQAAPATQRTPSDCQGRVTKSLCRRPGNERQAIPSARQPQIDSQVTSARRVPVPASRKTTAR